MCAPRKRRKAPNWISRRSKWHSEVFDVSNCGLCVWTSLINNPCGIWKSSLHCGEDIKPRVQAYLKNQFLLFLLCWAGIQCYASASLISQCQQVLLIRNLIFPFHFVLLPSMYFLLLTQQHSTPCAILVYRNLPELKFWVSQLPTPTQLPTVIVCYLLLPPFSAGAWLFLGKCVSYSSTSPVQASEEEGKGCELKPTLDGTATAATRRIGSCAQRADKTRRRDFVQCWGRPTLLKRSTTTTPINDRTRDPTRNTC